MEQRENETVSQVLVQFVRVNRCHAASKSKGLRLT